MSSNVRSKISSKWLTSSTSTATFVGRAGLGSAFLNFPRRGCFPFGFGSSFQAVTSFSHSLRRTLFHVFLASSHLFPLGANPYLPTGHMVSTWWVLKQNTQRGPTGSMLIAFWLLLQFTPNSHTWIPTRYMLRIFKSTQHRTRRGWFWFTHWVHFD